MSWLDELHYNPITPLLDSHNPIIEYFTRRDLLDEKAEPIDYIWNQPEALRIFKGQQSDGSWIVKTGYQAKYPEINYKLIETWKHFRFLTDKFEFNKNHQATAKAAEYIFSCQTGEGDIRGILANQYAIYYTGALLSHLIKAGYENDPRIEKGLRWLLGMRQNDGGWVANTLQTLDLPKGRINELTSTAAKPLKEHDKSEPFSHNYTGMVIRAFAAHSKYRKSPAALKAAELLKLRFFKEDNYPSYKHPDNWLRFEYPFWWNNLVAALDSLSLIQLSKDDADIEGALNWLIANQQKSGLWKNSYSKIHKAPESAKTFEMQLWITLAICRIMKRFYG